MSPVDSSKSHARKSRDESIFHIKEARTNWESGINTELEAIGHETKKKLISIRPPESKNPHLIFDNTAIPIIVSSTDDDMPTEIFQLESQPIPLNKSAGNDNDSTDIIRFLYDSEDFFETIINIKNINMDADSTNKDKKSNISDRMVGLIKLHCQYAVSLADLQKRFSDMSPSMIQVGIDESVYNRRLSSGSYTKLFSSLHEEAEAVASIGTTTQARKLLRHGVLPSLRSKIWRKAFGLENTVNNSNEIVASTLEIKSFNRLRELCDRIDYLSDDLYIYDVQTVIDESKFFVFEVSFTFMQHLDIYLFCDISGRIKGSCSML